VKTDEQKTTSIIRCQISHFRTEFYDGGIKVEELMFDDNVKTLHVYH